MPAHAAISACRWVLWRIVSLTPAAVRRRTDLRHMARLADLRNLACLVRVHRWEFLTASCSIVSYGPRFLAFGPVSSAWSNSLRPPAALMLAQFLCKEVQRIEQTLMLPVVGGNWTKLTT